MTLASPRGRPREVQPCSLLAFRFMTIAVTMGAAHSGVFALTAVVDSCGSHSDTTWTHLGASAEELFLFGWSTAMSVGVSSLFIDVTRLTVRVTISALGMWAVES